MAAQDAELKLKVSLDLAFFRQQLTGLGQVAAGYPMTIGVKFDRRSVQNELNALGANIRKRNYTLNVNTNLKTEIENAKKLAEALRKLQGVSASAKGGLPLGITQLSRTKASQGLDVSEIKKLYEALAIAGVAGFEQGTKKTRPQMVAQIGAVSKDTIAGLLNGLKSGDASIQAAAKSLGKNLIDSIKGVLGIASPSREFKKIGEDSGEGFEQGLKSGLGEAARIGIKEMRDLFRALQNEAQSGAARLQATMLGAMAGIVQLPGGRQQRQRLQQTGGTINTAMTGGALRNIQARQQGVRGQAAAASTATPAFLTALPLMLGMSQRELSSRLSGLYGQQYRAPNMGTGGPNALGQIIQSLAASRGALGTGGGIAGQLFTGGARNPGVSPSGYISRSALSAGYVNYPPGLPAAYGGGFTGAGGSRFKMNAGSMGQFPMAGMLGGGFGAGAGSFVPMEGGRSPGRLSRLFADLTTRMEDAGTTIRRQLMPTFGDLRQQVIDNRRRIAVGINADGSSLGSTLFLGQRGAFGQTQFRSEGMMLPQGMTTTQHRTAQNTTRLNAIGGGILGNYYSVPSGGMRGYQFPMAGMMGPSSPLGQVTTQSSMFNRRPGWFGGFGGGGGGGNNPPGGPPGNPPFGGGPIPNLPSSGARNLGAALARTSIPGAGAIRELTEEFAQATKQVLLYGTAYKGLAFLTSLPGQAFNAAKSMETFRNQLDAVTKSTNQFGPSLAFIERMVAELNVPIDSAREGFVRLYASLQPAGFDPNSIQNLFSGITKASATFGLSADQVDRVFYAFGQMASKGQVMSEELKGQLGDVLPGSMALFAEAAQMSMVDFSKALEDGMFKGDAMKVLLENVAILMNTKFSDAASKASKTLQGQLNAMQNSLQLMYEAMQPMVNAFAAAFGPQLTSLIKDATDVIKALNLGISTTGDSFALLSPRAQGFYAAIDQVLPSLRELVPSFSAAAKNVGYFVSSLLTVSQPLLALVKGFLDFISIPFVARVGVYATVIAGLTQALVLLRTTGIIQATIAMVRFIATLSVAQIRIWVAGIQTIIAVLISMIRQVNLARLSLMALKVTLVSFGVGAVLLGLDYVAQRLLKIGESADEARLKAAALTDELMRAVEAGDTATASAKYTEAETRVQSFEKAKTILQSIESQRKAGGNISLAPADFQKLQTTGMSSGIGYSAATGQVTRVVPGQIQESLKVLDSAYRQALNESGQARDAMRDARQVAENNQRELEQSRKKLTALPEGAGKPATDAKIQSLESYENLADQLAKARTEGEIERANILFEHKKKLLDMQFAYEESGADEIQQTRIKFAKELSDVLINYEEQVFKARQEVAKVAGSVAPGNRPPNAPKGQAPYGPITEFGAGANAGLQIGQQVGSLTPARPVSGSERRDVVAAATTVITQQTKTLELNKALEEANKKYALTIKQNFDTIFPVAQLTLQNKLLAMRNQAELKGLPPEVIELEKDLFIAREKGAVTLKVLADEFTKQLVIHDKYTKMQAEGKELTKEQNLAYQQAATVVNSYGDASSYATEKMKEMTVAQIENTLATLKQQDALKKVQETSDRINQAVEGVTGTYKDLFKEIAKGGDAVEALKKAQDALADQFLTMFFDFAMKPVEDFFKQTFGGMFGVPDEEKARQETISKLEQQLQEQKKIAAATQQTAINTGQGAAVPSGQSQSVSAGGISLPTGGGLTSASYGSAPYANMADFLNVEAIQDMQLGLGSLTDSAEDYADKLSKVDTSIYDSAIAVSDSADKAKENSQNLSDSLGKAVQGIGIAAGSIMGIAAGINQIKEGGTSNILGGIGSVLLSVGGAIGGFGKLFGWKNGGIVPGGFRAFADGGVVSGPTLGLVGEGRYNEAVVPLPDGKSIPVELGGSIRDKMNAPSYASAAPVLSMSFESTTINGVEYVSRDQLEQAMMETRRLAARDGAQKGATLAIDKLQQSPTVRRRVGIR